MRRTVEPLADTRVAAIALEPLGRRPAVSVPVRGRPHGRRWPMRVPAIGLLFTLVDRRQLLQALLCALRALPRAGAAADQ